MIDSCDEVSEEEQRLSSIDSTIRYETPATVSLPFIVMTLCSSLSSSQQWEEFKSWHEYDMAEDNFCEVDGETFLYMIVSTVPL